MFELRFRGLSQLYCFVPFFECKYSSRKKKWKLLLITVLRSQNSSDWDTDGNIQPICCGKENFEYEVVSLIVAFCGIYGQSGFLCKERNHFSVSKSSTKKLLIETCVEKIKPLLMERLRLENRDVSKSITFSAFLAKIECDTIRKINRILNFNICRKYKNSIGFSRKEIKPVVLKKVEFEILDMPVLKAFLVPLI